MIEWILVGVGIGFAVAGITMEIATNAQTRRRMFGCPDCGSRSGPHAYDCFWEWEQQKKREKR